MFFIRRSLQILKTKSRLIQKYQIRTTNKIYLKKNFRYLNYLNSNKLPDHLSLDGATMVEARVLGDVAESPAVAGLRV